MADKQSFERTLASQGIKYNFFPLENDVCGILYEPLTLNQKSSICILVMHSNSNYITNNIYEMARYGYRVFCARVSDPDHILDRKILDVKTAVNFLRTCPGIQKIILWGHSGGATLFSAYQKIAENGVASCQGPEKIHPCPDTLSNMPAADGIMLIDANWGNAAMTLFSIDPAVTAEDGSETLSQELNLFNPQNGFLPDGTVFGQQFIQKFQKAQGERSNRLIDTALTRLSAIERGESFYCDDEPFVIIGAAQGFKNNKLFAQDISLLSHTRQAWPLIHADGSITKQIVYSVRKPANNVSYTHSLFEGSLVTTVRNFLAEYAIRTTPEYSYGADSVTGVDWSSTYSSPVGNVESIKVPTLIMGMTAGWEYIASESIYEHSASTDRHLAFLEGANHLYQTATECENWPGQYGDTRNILFRYVDSWILQYFG